MKVVEIFKSIEGEGVRAGLPATFIRLYGCNLRCSYCDTKYSYEGENEEKAYVYQDKTVAEIMAVVKRNGCKTITVTGGEPLIHPHIEDLLDSLLFAGCHVNVETNGTVAIPPKYRDCRNIIFTMDYKCPGSGMNKEMKAYPFSTLRPWDVLKFVVSDERDLDKMLEVLENMPVPAVVFVSPVFGKIEPTTIVDFILKHSLFNVRVQLQLHKIIWDPDQRGV